MKKVVLTFVGLICSLGLTAQTIVSKEVQKRNVVLEEYTGVRCGYCPLGHENAASYAYQHPGRVITINIHGASYASYQGKDWYQTDSALSIMKQTNLEGFPALSVNREVKSCKINAAYPTDMGAFSATANSVLKEETPINVAATATVNAETREMNIHVELFYTKDVEQPFNALTVALLQNNIVSPKNVQVNYGEQQGAPYNPDQVLPDGSYNHMHMLRGFITDAWGDSIAINSDNKIPQGTYVEKDYTYTLPEKLTDEDVKLGDIYLVVFISDGKNPKCKLKAPNIYTGVEVYPEYTNLKVETVDAVINHISTSVQYGCNDLANASFAMFNKGKDIESMEIQYEAINTNDVHTLAYTEPIKPYQPATITLPEDIKVTVGKRDSIKVTITKINDEEVTITPKLVAVSKVAVTEGFGSPTLIIKTDKYGGEITWNVLNDKGETVQSGGPYTNGAIVSDTVLLSNITTEGCYTLEILDAGEDGAEGGLYKLIDATGKSLASNTKGSWPDAERKDFRITAGAGLNTANENIFQSMVYPNPAKDNTVLNVSVVNPSSAVITITDVLGRNVMTMNNVNLTNGENMININTASLENGVYYIKVITDNGTTTNKLSISK